MAALTEAEARARAEATVRAYCGWHVAPEQTDTIVVDGPGTGTLMLPSLRVSAVASITEDGTVLDVADYAWSRSGFVRRFPSTWRVDAQPRWTFNLRAVEVTFTHGFTDWPPDVAAILDRLADRTVAGVSMLSQVGAVSYATGQDGLPVGDSLTGAEQAVLDPYRLPYRP